MTGPSIGLILGEVKTPERPQQVLSNDLKILFDPDRFVVDHRVPLQRPSYPRGSVLVEIDGLSGLASFPTG